MTAKAKDEKYEGEEYDEQETDRQDRVDNAIANMIEELTPCGYWDWDMEIIGDIRDVLTDYVVNQKEWMTEQQFYPYRVIEDEEEAEENPHPIRMIVTVDQLADAVKKVIDELDFDNLAQVSSYLLGGICQWVEEDDFLFVPNKMYGGAFNSVKKEKSNGKS